MTPLISVVVPAFNEEPNIPKIHQAIRAAMAGENYELIFVDDGSSDGTAARIRELRDADSSVRMVRFGRNFGHQAALVAGLEAARGAAVITLDCDLQHPPELLPKMLVAWRQGARVVQMVRVGSAGGGRLKDLSSRLFYRFINLVSETPVVPGAADFQLLDRAVVQDLLRFRDRQPFLRGLVSWLGFESARIDYTPRPRVDGSSKYGKRRMLRLSLHALTGLSSKPLRASFYVGLAAAVFCLIYGVFAVAALAEGKTLPGWTSVVVLVAFLGAVQLVSVGILGEYIGRIYEQTRGTPRYVVVEHDEPPEADTFGQFVAAINNHDVDTLASLMTSDHLFVDSVGHRVQGAEPMRNGWLGYFAMCPDYWIRIDTLASVDGAVLAMGEAGGTIDNVPWRTPAAWKAVIRHGMVLEWRVFADNKPVYEILAKRRLQ